MEEQLISFETAKLAKEKGFNIYQDIQYSQEVIDKTITYNYTESQCRLFGDVYYAPTQSLLQRWLREEHEINIVIFPANNQESWFYGVNKVMWQSCSRETLYNSYEEALEAGLKEALKLIP